MRRHEWRLLTAAMIAADVAAIAAASALATALTRAWLPDAHLPGARWLAVLMGGLTLLAFLTQGLYAPRGLVRGTRELAGVARGCAYGAIGFVLAGFVISQPIPRLWSALSWALIAVAAGCGRQAIRAVATHLRRRGLLVERALLVGADQHSLGVARQLSRPGTGLEVVGVLDDCKAPGTVLDGRFRVLGTPAELARVAAAAGARDAIVVPDALAWETMRRVLTEGAVSWQAGRVHLSAGYHDLLTTGVRVSERNHVPLLTLKRVALTPFEAAAKRTLDCVLATLLLGTLGPLALLVVLRARARGIDSPVRRRTVLGRHGARFEMATFEPALAPSGLVRKLPALGSVLRGDLSIVGPSPRLAGTGGEPAPGQDLAVRPGLTGLWREAGSPTEQATLDLYYVRSYSLWLDLHVLLARAATRLRPRRRAEAHRAGEAVVAGGSRAAG